MKFRKYIPFKWSLTLCALAFLIILLLQFVAQYLVTKLTSETSLMQEHITRMEKQLQQTIMNLEQSLNTTVISSDGTYRIIQNVIDGKLFEEDKAAKVTLISHCSPNHLINIIKIAKIWHGPMVVTIYAPRKSLSIAVLSVFHLFKCYQTLLQKVTIHFATEYPDTSLISLSMLNSTTNCSKATHDDQIYEHSAKNYNKARVKYPNNLLRNVGIRSASTLFVFVVDIDFIPSENLFESLNNFLTDINSINNDIYNGTEDFKVFVIPAFEIKTGYDIPRTKRTLLAMLSKGIVRPFYYEMCMLCHEPTQYNLWKALPLTDGLSVAYTIEWQDPWEPFYIAPKSMPLYDERFQQYGFNRISQSCELHVAGYKFHVMDNAFIIHKGFKTNSTFHTFKNIEQENNRLLFRKFKKELKTKYPDSTNRC